MKKIAAIGGGLLLLVTGVVLLPWYVGMKAEEGIRTDHEMIAQELLLPGLTITLADYQRHWYSAEATTLITIAPERESDEPLRLEVHHAISHLPSLWHGAIASVTSDVALPAKWKADAERVLNGQSPLTVVTYIGITGSDKAVLSSPAFKTTLENGAVDIEWQGVQGEARESGDNSHIVASLTMPGLKLKGPQANIDFEAMNYEIDMVRGSYDMWFGKSSAALKSLHIDSDDGVEKHRIAVNNIRINTEQNERDEVTDGNGIIEVGKSSIDEVTLDSAVYDFEFRNLDTKTMHDIQTALQRSYSEGDSEQMGMVMFNAIPELLKAKPEINIRRLEMQSSLGNFNGKLHLAFIGEWSDAMLANPLAILPMLDANLELAMSKGLLQTIAQSQMHSSLVAMAQMRGEVFSNAELDTMAAERASQQLALMEANGYLQQKDENYTTMLQFNKGQLTINGKAANEFFGPR